jgi:DNA-binding NarL/FixJ family response regulator
VVKILVVDDHPLVVDALAQLLPQIDPEMVVRTDRETDVRELR